MTSCTSETYSVDPYHICGVCMENFPVTNFYTCDRGHLICTNCYKQEYYTGKQRKCPYKYCNCWMSKVVSQSEDFLSGIKRMFPCPWEVSRSKKQLDLSKSFGSLLKIGGDTGRSISSLSRKPISCPFSSCNKTIAVTTFYEHFRYEHPSVTFLDTKFDSRNGLNFNVDSIQYNERHCMLLINIVNNRLLKGYNSRTTADIPATTPSLLVVAVRIRCTDTYENDHFSCQDTEEEENDSSVYDPHACTGDDRILFWIASNIVSKYSYTLAISTLDNEIRQKYIGPVLTLNEDPLKLCSEGRGLILTKFHVKTMTENESKPLVMDFIIHDETDQNDYLSELSSDSENNESSEENLF